MSRQLLCLSLLCLLAGSPYLAGLAASGAVLALVGWLLFGPGGKWL